MKKIILYLFSFLIIITLFSCKKQEEQKTSTINLDLSGDTLDDADPRNDLIEIDGIFYKDLLIPSLGISMLLPDSFEYTGGSEYYLKFTSPDENFLGIEISISAIPNTSISPESLIGFTVNSKNFINNTYNFDTQFGTILDFKLEDFSTLEKTLVYGDKTVYIPTDLEVPDISYIQYLEYDSPDDIPFSSLSFSRNNLIGEYYYGEKRLCSADSVTCAEFYVQYNFSLHNYDEVIVSVVSPIFSKETSEKIISAITENLVYTDSVSTKDSSVRLRDYALPTENKVALPDSWRVYQTHGLTTLTCDDINSAFFGYKILLIKEDLVFDMEKVSSALMEGTDKVTDAILNFSQAFPAQDSITYSISPGYYAPEIISEFFPLDGKGFLLENSGDPFYVVLFAKNTSTNHFEKFYKLLEESN